jgi:hypothetical protein
MSGFAPQYLKASQDALLSGATLRLYAFDATYTRSLAHEFLDDATAAGGLISFEAVTGYSCTIVDARAEGSIDDIRMDLGDVSFTAQAGETMAFLWLVIWTGDAATSRLVRYYDAFTPADMTNGVTWSFAANNGLGEIRNPAGE